MKYASAEDRLNPVTPPEITDDTLGGYQAVHGRAAAFEASDGEPYTAAVETDETGDPGAPWSAYLVFVRWAQTGTAIMGHLETGDLATASTEDEARAALESLPLARVREILEDTIRARATETDLSPDTDEDGDGEEDADD
ncbi:hypothetical protein [Longimicrobium sp.]|uniref:hypothetical protein n=1 Tax=Longimicrobium sp. TaxID=2029185 RepID=UPI002D0E3378|nr:hypothetical protein [Longimicrobium sp.]HSU16602.1 hypothetical protein [Longimicrobium sp.]